MATLKVLDSAHDIIPPPFAPLPGSAISWMCSVSEKNGTHVTQPEIHGRQQQRQVDLRLRELTAVGR